MTTMAHSTTAARRRRRRLVSGACAGVAVAATTMLGAVTSPAAAADACPPPNPNASAPSRISAAERDTILRIHNQARAATGASPALAPLTWDTTLADKAQGWANIVGPSRHSDCHSASWASGQGENIADFGTVQAGVQFWYAEKATYRYPTPVGPGAPYLHYTQMVWRDTVKIGCGKAPSPKYWPTNIVIVCRYAPAGNVWGRLPY